ncbi:MAG: hypothetical protein AAF213_09480 [Pseudomonadota bacterium]
MTTPKTASQTTPQTTRAKNRRVSLAVVSISILVVIVISAGVLYGRLVYRCAAWFDTGMGADLNTHPVTVIQNLAGLVSEPVCDSRVSSEVWVKLGTAYNRVPSIEDINRRRALGAFQQAALLDPSNNELRLELADAFVNQGQFHYALRPASIAHQALSDNARATRLLTTTHIAIENRTAAIALLDQTYDPGEPMPFWAWLAVETLQHPVIDDEVAPLVPLITTTPSTRAAQFNQAVAMAFRLGLQRNEAAMTDALAAIALTDAAPGDLLDGVMLYEQVGLTDQIIDALLAKQQDSPLNEAEKLRLIRSLWLHERHQDVIDLYAQDIAFQRYEPEAGLMMSLARHAQGLPQEFAAQLEAIGDKNSRWDDALIAFQQLLDQPDGMFAEDLLDTVLALREFLPQSAVLSILSAAVWQHLEEPELVQNSLQAARQVMGPQLTNLDRIPQPPLALRVDPARDQLMTCSSENLTAAQGAPLDEVTITACWDRLINEYPSSILVIRAALSHPRLTSGTDKHRQYLTQLEANSPNQAAFWRRAKARDYLTGKPSEQDATEALLLLRPLLQQPDPRPETLMLTAAAYGALRDVSRSFQHLSETILVQPSYAPLVHGLSLDIYQDQPTLLPRTLIQWWEIFAVLEAQAMFGGHNDEHVRELIADVLDRRYAAMNAWATDEQDERLQVALSLITSPTPDNKPTSNERDAITPNQ